MKLFLLSAIVLGLSVIACFSQSPANKLSVILRGPYLQSAGSSGITIRWSSSADITGAVRYGSSPQSLDKRIVDSGHLKDHVISIENLLPYTKYYYRIETDGANASAKIYSFRTLPVAGKPGLYRIAAVGDCGNNSVNQYQVRDQLLKYIGKKELNAWILLGDNAYSNGRDAEFQQNFFHVYDGSLLPYYPLFPAPGNHDYRDDDPAKRKTAQLTHRVPYYDIFSMPYNGQSGGVASGTPAYYSFDLGNIHFLSLDSYGMEGGQYRIYNTLGPQAEWVKKDLAANRNKGWVVAYWHHPPYTMGSHDSDDEDELVHIRENFIRILERNGVDLVLSGHSHDYERSKLMSGYYGMNAQFSPEFLISNSSGEYDGSSNSCPYIKDSTDHMRGTVYVVSGSAGQLGGKQLKYPHRAMPFSNADTGGVSIIEVQDNRLDLKWLCSDGKIRDHFVMMKEVNKNIIRHIKKGESITLSASYPGRYHWNLSRSASRTIRVKPVVHTIYEVSDGLGCLKDRFEIMVD